MNNIFLILLLWVGLGNIAIGQENELPIDPISYVVDLADSKNHYLKITATVPVVNDSTELMMAVWTPGSYLIREYARHIDSLKISSKGESIEFEKIRKNRWRVETKGLKSFQVSYRLYCNEMSVRTNWVGQQYAMMNGAPTFLTVVGRLDQPHRVRLKLPRNWSRSATSLRSYGDLPHSYEAQDFDELVDSPIVAGNIQVYPFEVAGVPHQLVNVGESGIWDGTRAATDLKKIVQAHHEMWNTVPYDRYLFLNMICESGGGLEHDNSTLIMTSRWSYRESGRYESWLSLASHEFFHTWNVRRLRPRSLVDYDYENEVYTPSLWVAEGVTSYYEDLLLVRAGLINSTEYLSRLSQNVESVQRTLGRTKQSLKESSFDTWIKFYRPDENSSNTRISYYSTGAVAAFLLDAKIRRITSGEKSLDDVMRLLYENYVPSGYTSEDFRNTVTEVAGQELADWFARTIDSTEELDYRDLEFLGIALPNAFDASKFESPDKRKSKESKQENSDGDSESAKNGNQSSVAKAIASVFRSNRTRSKNESVNPRLSPPGRPSIGVGVGSLRDAHSKGS
ncbi:MAG: hypothetical protein AAF623_15240 [Planctomycetota bacterium]